MDALAEYKVIGGYTVTLYPNRVEIVQKMLGANINILNKVVAMKTISKVEIPMAKRPQIETINGEIIILNLYPKQAKDFRARIMELL